DPVLIGVTFIWLLAFAVLAWVWRGHIFEGKNYFILSFGAILWWVFSLGMELASTGFEAKLNWALSAWLSIAILPVSWSLYIEQSIRGLNASMKPGYRLFTWGVPFAVVVAAITNPWHQQLFTDSSALTENGNRVNYEHGVVFFASALALYYFVFRSLWLIATATLKTSGSAKSLLTTLAIITVVPLTINAAYVFGGLTFLGIDPTPLSFSIGLAAYSWMLVTNRLLDTRALGRDALFLVSEDPAMVVDKDNRVISWNNAAERHLFSRPVEVGDPTDRIAAPVMAFIRKLKTSHGQSSGEQFRVLDRVFEPRAIAIACPLDPNQRRIGWSISFIDVTERVAFEDSLK
ncbi:unnamed protein product, partial [Chrysoparadoxa australica]